MAPPIWPRPHGTESRTQECNSPSGGGGAAHEATALLAADIQQFFTKLA